MSRSMKLLGAVVALIAVVFVPTVAMTGGHAGKIIDARRGYMKLVGWESGPLFGMAKGEVEYNAEVATTNAANLKHLTQYTIAALFIPGTSNEEEKGKTRALKKIWDDPDGFKKALDDWIAAVDALQAAAGNGKDALAAAVGGLGKSCGGCHKPYRAEDF